MIDYFDSGKDAYEYYALSDRYEFEDAHRVLEMLRATEPVTMTCRDWAAAVDALRLWAYDCKHRRKYQSIEGDMAEAARYFSVTVSQRVRDARTPGLGSGNELTVPLTLSEVRGIQVALRFCRADEAWNFSAGYDDLMPGRVRTPTFVRAMDRVQEQIDETDRRMEARECNFQVGEWDPAKEFMDIGETFFC